MKILDEKILALVTRMCHKFQRLTGRTNFFLAKLALLFVWMSIAVSTANFWLPLLHRKTDLFSLFLYVIISIGLLVDIKNCDKAEGQVLEKSKAKVNFDSLSSSWMWRVLWLAITLWDIVYLPSSISDPKGFLLFKCIYFLFCPGFTTFYYFINVEPLPPAKSTVREWIEAFATSMRKLVPIRNN
ncbi:MAG: hypothetical protein A3H69_01135 [Candidatus Sungbacteria bacterium RIFCSPLOWO2_02_FULL_47_9]|uniref:Uncharacterized protein n=1 Tax=Candidatus Sungbacteria bacterium RIFCSPHIGHO2_01_FULL_47_32 TaxID=1802264 RepID=A0A1G2K5U0_9BACT|nr:MAG: hypothetical protein UX72_C0030G0004 [Parcubacteria group bacterium GW2011_GWA2_47_10]OGZ93798.1 MAG: hypothetical protein A2633_04960 [Candidatus Sungbacteria bacterium RIFCSPHIGHO2_01_FULL_47_32]OGZ99652.1 MAG: hypothetical protein A3D57_04175 [Candidatus Sungbacteria bacterium RIFCSPHIGHO2_02_FULL_46_12]OHA05696.1 MAG: hypothetical protein A3A28_01490 [Candidatus Sungbacteria bacterium RIFCSPLOWO2_01_FULL_47_32]OHA12130.1 MAG: hypothetical protein A3H69_01135 [Candidatus Sungbacteria